MKSILFFGLLVCSVSTFASEAKDYKDLNGILQVRKVSSCEGGGIDQTCFNTCAGFCGSTNECKAKCEKKCQTKVTCK